MVANEDVLGIVIVPAVLCHMETNHRARIALHVFLLSDGPLSAIRSHALPVSPTNEGRRTCLAKAAELLGISPCAFLPPVKAEERFEISLKKLSEVARLRVEEAPRRSPLPELRNGDVPVRSPPPTSSEPSRRLLRPTLEGPLGRIIRDLVLFWES